MMSQMHDYERAFFSYLRNYNTGAIDEVPKDIGLTAALMGEASLRHLERYYPECVQD